MCDYCGCRRSGPTAELAVEHVRLLELGDQVHDSLFYGDRRVTDVDAVFSELTDLLQMHAVKEEIGLFEHAKQIPQLADRITDLCQEHQDLYHWLADGPSGARVADALRLLVTHIEDEEYDLFPHIINVLDPEQWDEITLAHRAVEAAWAERAG
ncbi:MAG: hemerythrin domain-containing protein [Ilumatobacteraceae bacterium]